LSVAFDRLARPVQKWIRTQGWHELRRIQVRAVPAVLDGEADLILAATTAGGKTEAAFLPLISQVLEADGQGSIGFDLLYIGPLKALINDQQRRLDAICRDVELPIVPWHGDVSVAVKKRALKHPSGILMITPESLEAMFVRRGQEIPRLFGRVRAVVIDELHTLLESERGIHLRSLLTRLELAVGRRIRRIGLSATLGDMDLARAHLRPSKPENVDIIEGDEGKSELQLQLRGYVCGKEDSPPGDAAIAAIAAHLFSNLRGCDNLVFAGSREQVEKFADRLRQSCEDQHLPQEFFPHHANLSRDHRVFVEDRLKDVNKPTTAICTSTLELGIDIGDIACVAQIGAPFTVAGLRQRLGRSGRRPGQPAILRHYVIEKVLTTDSDFCAKLRLGLVRSIAMIELLLERWCEPPKSGALHLSTLVHQVLSVIAERGGASAERIYLTLCERGPFSGVRKRRFLQLLRHLGRTDVGLIEQSDDGLLLLGKHGEKLVEHYNFYAVFRTPEEFRLDHDGKKLGTMPVTNILAPGMTLIFSGRRWEVVEIHDRERIIRVKPSQAGVPPRFRGDPGDIDDRVIARMRQVLEGDEVPQYLDRKARQLLREARTEYKVLELVQRRLVQIDKRSWLLATWRGTVRNNTMALSLRSFGLETGLHDGFLEVRCKNTGSRLEDALYDISKGKQVDLFAQPANLRFEKFHSFLSEELLKADALSSRLDPNCLPQLASDCLSGVRKPV